MNNIEIIARKGANVLRAWTGQAKVAQSVSRGYVKNGYAVTVVFHPL